MKDYTTRRLEEFEEKFIEYEICDNPDHGGLDAGLFGDDNSRIGCPLCGHDEERRIKSTAHISKKPEEIKSFISESIHQAEQEILKKMNNKLSELYESTVSEFIMTPLISSEKIKICNAKLAGIILSLQKIKEII